jgi:hypothetical protein
MDMRRSHFLALPPCILLFTYETPTFSLGAILHLRPRLYTCPNYFDESALLHMAPPSSKIDCTETHLHHIIQVTALELLCRVLGTHESQQEGLQVGCAAA